ncbi:F-box domain-containing protein [Favolaschia claudopus]|uniref:F-box domain-containing protein n=1 Tax=Favolaschia claudopus TaxID=2862362 RepID=A0AAW0C580_9AGAR
MFIESCDPLCPFRFASEEKFGCVPIPLLPELLSSTSGLPSESQTKEIMQHVGRLEDEISTTNSQIARLTAAIEQLIEYRVELAACVKSYRGLVSALRGFPNELLVEIFERCLDSDTSHLYPHQHASWVISHVCSRWRGVALSTPSLWRHIHVPDYLGFHPSLITTQLERAGPMTQLLIELPSDCTTETLNRLLSVSAQWAEACLYLTFDGFSHFFRHTGKFSALKTLSLSSWRAFPSTFDVNWDESLPLLQEIELKLSNEKVPRQLPLPWAQLRVCAVKDISSLELLWLISQLSGVATVSVLNGTNSDNEVSTSPTRSTLISLSLNDWGDYFVSDFLKFLVTPALETLRFESTASRLPMSLLLPFLKRSKCVLKRLSIDAYIPKIDLIVILKLTQLRSVSSLELPCAAICDGGIAELASLRQLRTLEVQNSSNMDPFLAQSLREALPNIDELVFR